MTRMMPTPPVIVKLGGSVVTDKKVPFSYRENVVRSLGRAMASSHLPIVLVHGGGSFGHTLAKRYGLSSSRSNPSSAGVSETREAMFRLNGKVCGSLSAAGLRPYAFSPFSLLERESQFIERLLAAKMTPVTFGDVVNDGKGFRVLSGDTICVQLAEMLAAPRCVLALDVEGVLDENGDVIKELGDADAAKVLDRGSRRGRPVADATGGISLKLSEARRMASIGTEVRLVSGLRPADFSKALSGLEFTGTTIKVVPQGVSSR